MRILTQVFVLFALSNLNAQISFYKLYSGNGYDKGEGIVQLEDSSYIITGSSSSWEGSSQAFLLKIDSVGNYKWSQNFGGPESETGKRVLYNKDLGFYIAGFTNSFGAGDFDAYLVRTNLSGEKIWEKNYGKSTHWERVNDAIMDADSNIVLIGETINLNNGNSDILIIKTTKNGDTLWTRTLGGEGEDVAKSIVNFNENYLIGGHYFVSDSNLIKGFIIELNSSGNVVRWDMIGHKSGNYSINDLSIGVNKVYVAGNRIVSSTNNDAYTGIYDFSGQLINHYTITDGSDIRNERFMQISYNPIKNKVAMGYQTINPSTYQDNFDVILAYFDPTELYWMNQFQSINNQGLDEINDIIPTSDGGYIAIGSSQNTGLANFTFNGGTHIYALKVDKNDAYPTTQNNYVLNQLVSVAIKSEILKGKVYPNPFNGEFTIELDGNESTKAVLLNNLGQELNSFDFEGTITYSTSHLKSGTYFLRIGNSVTKLVKLD